MIIGVPKEIKNNEYRVAIVPVGVEELVNRGHAVLIEKGAGLGTGISDEEYGRYGAEIVDKPAQVYKNADLILKVKEPLPEEYDYLKAEQAVFTFFHFAANRELTLEMAKRKVTCIAYETVEDETGSLPILIPMSEVAGRMAVQEGAKCLEKPMFGRGILLGGVPGVAPANVMILGGGILGTEAARIASGMGARVCVLDVKLNRLRYLDDIMPRNVTTLMSNSHNIKSRLAEADLVIGAVLIHGAKPPVLITREMLGLMKPGAVIVDCSIDQGGCAETSKPTTHASPTYVVDGIVHYCVTNMPGALAGTSTYALTNVTLPYVLELAGRGMMTALKENRSLAGGVNIIDGKVTLKAIADEYSLRYYPVEEVFNQ